MVDIDSIVCQILSDLTVTPKPVRTEPEQLVADDVYIGSRVVSLTEINERLGNAKKLFISPKSILTPSAKDEIRKRKIEVTVKLSPQTVTSCLTFWFALHQPVSVSTNLISRLQKEFSLKQESFGTLVELFDEAEKQLSNKNKHGIVLTKQSAMAIRLASRRDSLRPILGVDPKQTLEDSAELNANLLIIHPERVSESKLYAMIKQK